MRDNKFENKYYRENKQAQYAPKAHHTISTPSVKSGLHSKIEKYFVEVTRIVNEFPKKFQVQDGYRFAIFNDEKQLCCWRETNEEWEAIQGATRTLTNYKVHKVFQANI